MKVLLSRMMRATAPVVFSRESDLLQGACAGHPVAFGVDSLAQ